MFVYKNLTQSDIILAISISGADVPTDETLNLTKDYVDGKIELEELQQKIIDKYNKDK